MARIRLIEPVTPRLVLRQWRDTDREQFAALNADPVVMEHFPAPLTRAESDAMVDRLTARIDADGYGLWAVEVRDTHEFIGFVGLARPTFETAFTPCTEIGWRLARAAWGQGFATEAASAALDVAFGPLGLDEVLSWTFMGNLASRAVMERLGMTRDPADDFDHPRLPEGDRLRRHVLHRIRGAMPSRPPTSSVEVYPRRLALGYTSTGKCGSQGWPVSTRWLRLLGDEDRRAGDEPAPQR
ncbi:GNAT family N-acetyltransferase [Lapillicoccus sp.]|uniref:GNAT family N-acetyltransferase n=1 Tax=Lapillicoccus sp. TaxID=1909287 RepID=UPI0039830D45